MTRKSRRELERALDDLDTGPDESDGERTDVGRGVTAPFVTYESAPADLPEGLVVAETAEHDGATYTVVRSATEGPQ